MGARARVRQTARGPVSRRVIDRHNKHDFHFTWSMWAAQTAQRERDREIAWLARQMEDNPEEFAEAA